MVPHIEIIDSGNTINAYEDKPNGRILVVLQRPRIYSRGPYILTVPRTGERKTRVTYGFAMLAFRRMAAAEFLAINA